jgi:XTP/dITP diphosphohydrolase
VNPAQHPFIVLATDNAHKVAEIQAVLSPNLQMRSKSEVWPSAELPETQTTLAGNALQKAMTLYNELGVNCLSDDTGLMINALNGEPGVYSARFAGPQRDAGDNMALVLKKLEGKADRSAKFVTVMTLILNGKRYLFEGAIHGQILTAPRGHAGFGYDPIFKPDGYDRSFAEMSAEEKNSLSHRSRAVAKLVAFLEIEP